MKRLVSLFFCILLFVSCNEKASSTDDLYLEIVKSYVKTMLEKGRDRYGAESSPLFASALDRETMRLPEGKRLEEIMNLSKEEWGIRAHDRILTGGNVQHQQNLYQILYALSEWTGDSTYKREADQSLKWFFERCQSPVTGLMAWGEHLGWDFHSEQIVRDSYHEFFRPWVLWDKSFELAPGVCTDFALGLWNHQIYDQKTGEFSRHAKWSEHAPGTKRQFPRHGGFYIRTWAEAYYLTGDEIFLEAIKVLCDFFENNASKESGAIPAQVGDEEEANGRMIWPVSNVSLAIDLWDSAEKLPGEHAVRMRNMALKIDSTFLKIPHQLSPDGEGFMTYGNVHTLQPEDVANWGKRFYSDLWATGYGEATDALVANTLMLRYQQNQEPRFRAMILATAQRYINSDINLDYPVYPGTFGDIIWLMISAQELSGEDKFLERAHYYAREGVSLFLKDSTLPAASSNHTHYEAITKDDTFMMSLLKLYIVEEGRDKAVINLIWSDR